ncbi:MAG: hypothetical protein QM790_08920 [Nibricoccus sp.]
MSRSAMQEERPFWPRVWDATERYVRMYFRYALAIIFIWFGALKIFHVSPISELVSRTFSMIPRSILVPGLGWWEVAIGVCFLFRRTVKTALVLLLLQLPGTFMPFFVVPEMCYKGNPLLLTVEGEFIVKNLLIIGAALLIGSTLHPTARRVSEPEIRK